MRIWGLIILSLMTAAAEAAIPSGHTLFTQTLGEKKNHYIADGVFTGGKAGMGATILGVRRTFSAKLRVERIIVDVGDREGQAAAKQMGYFQASVDAATNRMVLDLSQLRMTKVSEPMIKALFKKSAYVENSEFTLDPEDKTASLVLQFKKPMRLEVFQLLAAGKPARIVMDLTPVQAKR